MLMMAEKMRKRRYPIEIWRKRLMKLQMMGKKLIIEDLLSR